MTADWCTSDDPNLNSIVRTSARSVRECRCIGPIECRRGVLLLTPKNIEILRGEVDSLLVCNAVKNVLARKLDLEENPNPLARIASTRVPDIEFMETESDVEMNLLSNLVGSNKKFVSYPDAGYPSCLSSDTSSLSTSSRTTSPTNILTDCGSKFDLSELPERKAPGFERSVSNTNIAGGNHYQQLRIQAAQAMQGIPNQAEVRVPTKYWSGYGFSSSSPSPIPQSTNRTSRNDTLTDSAEGEVGNSKSIFNDSVENSKHYYASNYLDAAASSTFNVVTSSNYSDLPSLLASLSLEKYIQLFKANEIDLSIFQTLTEDDLKEIAVLPLLELARKCCCVSPI